MIIISNHRHVQQLQDDLDKLGEWESKWMLELNTNKCQVITISRKRNKIHHQYCLNNTPLTVVNSTKYLGITITSDLKWNQHTSNICQKANNTLAFLRRNLHINSPDLKATAYKALVRPLVEYCSTVWDPSTNKSIHQLEMVQRRAARFTLNRYHYTSSVESMLSELDWPSLQQRSENFRQVMMYKLHNNLVHFTTETYISQMAGPSRTVHSQGYYIPHSRTEHHIQSFFPRTARAWNILPVTTVTATSLEASVINWRKAASKLLDCFYLINCTLHLASVAHTHNDQ